MSTESLKKPPFGPWPQFSEAEVEASARILRSGKVNYWTGQEGREFEKEFAAWCGTSRAIALANGTVALELALKGLKLEAGDEVIMTPRTFVATATACTVHNFRPIFADVDPDSGGITAASIERVITEKTKAIIPVHLGGWPCDMPAIMDLAASRNLKVIEDCAQAHGARVNGQSVGSFGHINAWSFCQDKIITTAGEGGMVTTDDEEAWDWMWSYKDHGKVWDAVYNRQHAPGFRWVQERFGTNWRLTEIQSAIGRIQLAGLPEWAALRSRNAGILNTRLGNLPGLRVPVLPDNLTHAWYRWYGYVRQEALQSDWNRDRIMAEINAAGVPCTIGSCSEIYLEKSFERCGMMPAERLPVAQELGDTAIALLVHPTLDVDAMSYVADVVESVLKRAQKN